jgi:hypothetical protein
LDKWRDGTRSTAGKFGNFSYFYTGIKLNN